MSSRERRGEERRRRERETRRERDRELEARRGIQVGVREQCWGNAGSAQQDLGWSSLTTILCRDALLALRAMAGMLCVWLYLAIWPGPLCVFRHSKCNSRKGISRFKYFWNEWSAKAYYR